MMLAPSPYSQAADLVLSLGTLTAEARDRLTITPAVQAKRIGISLSTLTRLEAGSVPTRPTIVAVLRWLAVS